MSITITLCLTTNILPARQPMPTNTLQQPHMDTIKPPTLTSTKHQSPPMGPPVNTTPKLVLYTMSPFGNGSAQLITGMYTHIKFTKLDSCRYDCTKGRRKRSILTLLKLLVGKRKKEKKKCDSVPVRSCPTVAKVRPVVKCEHH